MPSSLIVEFQTRERLLEVFGIGGISSEFLRFYTNVGLFSRASHSSPWVIIAELLGKVIACISYWPILLKFTQRSAWHLFCLSCDHFVEESDQCKDRLGIVVSRIRPEWSLVHSFLRILGCWTQPRITMKSGFVLANNRGLCRSSLDCSSQWNWLPAKRWSLMIHPFTRHLGQWNCGDKCCRVSVIKKDIP